MMRNETISLDEYVELVKKWYITKHDIDSDVLIFNVKNYYNLAYGFLIRKFTDIGELTVSQTDKCISTMSFICLLSDTMFLTYNFVDEHGNREPIKFIIWVDKNDELPEKRIDNGYIVISFQMIKDFILEMWNDLYDNTPELAELQKLCIKHSTLMDMIHFDEYQNNAIEEMFYTVEVDSAMKQILAQ